MPIKSKLKKSPSWQLSFIILLAVYLLTHLFKLTKLPVFADEAIYIRWAQLIIDQPSRYAFFPLNDGKTPLFIWLLVPFQFLFADPLFAGRFLSVLVGLGQVYSNAVIVKKLGGGKLAQVTSGVLTVILPFWFFHHRMALMDSMLTLFLSVSWLLTLSARPAQNKISWLSWKHLKPFFLSGLFLGLALLTKIPALLFIPSIIVTNLILHSGQEKLIFKAANAAVVIGVGLSVFALLKLHPAFGQLFNRGGDFLYSYQELIGQKNWQGVCSRLVQYSQFILHYLTWPVIVLSFVPVFRKYKKQAILSHLSWLAFAYPIFILGKVVYPRYLLPAAIMLTALASLGVECLWQEVVILQKKQKILAKTVQAGLISLLLVTTAYSLNFIKSSYFNLEQIPFTDVDKTQYLYEWSAGFGVKETKTIVSQLAKDKQVLVITEGYFGTLPDALLMYFHRRDANNIYITGMGQPIGGFSDEIRSLAENYQQVLLVANSHRIKTDLKNSNLLFERCRPNQAPCHQVWDITQLLANS